MHSRAESKGVYVCVWLAAEQDGQNVGGKAESPVERCQARTQVRSGPGNVLISSALSAAHTPLRDILIHSCSQSSLLKSGKFLFLRLDFLV